MIPRVGGFFGVVARSVASGNSGSLHKSKVAVIWTPDENRIMCDTSLSDRFTL